MSVPLNYSFRNLWFRRRATFSIAAGVALVVLVLAASLMLATGVRSVMLRAGSPQRAILVQHGAFAEDDSRISQVVLGAAAAAPGVSKDPSGSPLVSGETVLHMPFPTLGGSGRIASVQIRGVTASAFALRPEVHVVKGRAPIPGADEAIVGMGLLGGYRGLGFGESFEMKHRHIEIVGAFDAQGSVYESEVWVDLNALRTSFGWEGYVSSVTAKLDETQAFDIFSLSIEGDKRNDVSVERESAYYAKLSENLSAIITGLGLIVTLVFSLAAALGAVIGLDAAVSQRRREIGVLKALGFSQTQVLLAFVAEASIIAVLGVMAGLLLACSTQLLDFTTANSATGQVVRFPFVLTGENVALPILVGGLVGVLGGLFPALRAARVNAIVAMRN